MGRFTREDCLVCGKETLLRNKVVVLKEEALPPGHPDQLFVCIGGDTSDHLLEFSSLSTGKIHHAPCSAVLGLLKPELLPEEAKLQLSQIRPDQFCELETAEAEYSGYCFLEDGRYAAGVWLASPQEVKSYVEMQKEYQYRVLICDRDDFAVMEIVEGQLIFPDQETLEAFRKAQSQEGEIQMT